MANTVKQLIQALVDLESKGWNTKNPDLFLSMIHPDMPGGVYKIYTKMPGGELKMIFQTGALDFAKITG